MKTKAAVLRGVGQDFEITELDLDPPKAGEVLIRFVAAGLCHSDEHLRHGDIVPRFPIVGGHEGAGIIEEVGQGVTRLKPGDHVICSFLPVCGHCRWCSTGKSNLCDLGATILDGMLPDGTYRFHQNGEDLGGMSMLGTFSERAVISENSAIKVDDDLPLDKVVLIGCGVPTGFGSAVHAAATEPGDTIAIYGIGGIGINAVQGAALAGARNVIAIDPIALKRETAEKLGATHSAATAEEAQQLITELTRGVGADKAIVTVGVVDSEVVTNAFNAIRKGGTVVVTGLADPSKTTIEISGAILTLFEKRIQGSLFGSGDPFHDIPRMVELYQSGDLKLDELITTTYTLDQVNQGYEDLIAGKNIRGVIKYADACPRDRGDAAGRRRVIARRRPAPAARGAHGRARGRPARGDRGPARHRKVHAAARDRPRLGARRDFRRGQRGAHPGPADRAARPLAGARGRVHAGHVRRRAAARGDAFGRAAVSRGG